MGFSIKFLDEPVPSDWLLEGEHGVLVDVTIGDFVERDTIITGFWSKSDYISQWIDALGRIIDGEDGTKAALATAVHDPQNPKHGYVVQWWPLYKYGDNVYVRNGSIPYNKRNAPIDLKKLYSYIGDRESASEGVVSEWATNVNDIVAFKRELHSDQAPQ